MKKVIRGLKQKLKDFYKQLPNKLEYIKAKIDEIKPAIIKDSKVTKDSGLIVSAFIGLVLGVIFGVAIGVTLYSYKMLISFAAFAIVHTFIGFFRKRYVKENSRRIDVIDTLLFIELWSCLIALGITVIGSLIAYLISWLF